MKIDTMFIIMIKKNLGTPSYTSYLEHKSKQDMTFEHKYTSNKSVNKKLIKTWVKESELNMYKNKNILNPYYIVTVLINQQSTIKIK